MAPPLSVGSSPSPHLSSPHISSPFEKPSRSVVRPEHFVPVDIMPPSETTVLLSERVASLTLENTDLKMKNAALEQRTNELLQQNQHLQLDMHSASTLGQLRRDNLALEERLDTAMRKKKELRAKTVSLYTWNARLHKQVAALKDRLLHAENRSLPDQIESASPRGSSKLTTASSNHGAVSRGVATGTPSTGVVLFNPKIPMTPIVGIEGSRYVALDAERSHFQQKIERDAYVDRNGKDVVVPCTFVINKSFKPNSVADRAPILTYVGFTYPDKTSLCYIPVSDVVMQYRNNIGRAIRVSRGDETWTVVYGGTHVCLGVNKDVYKAIVSRALKAFGGCDEQSNVMEGDSKKEKDMVWFDAGLKKRCTVQMLKKNKYVKTSVARALKESNGDVRGEALLYMRFSLKAEVDSVPTLSFRFHTLKEAAGSQTC